MNDSIDARPQWKTNQPTESSLTELRMAIDQLWTKTDDAIVTLDNINQLLDTDVNQKRLIALIKGINGHSSSMPDFKGVNEDHDMRYATLMKLRQYLKNPTANEPLMVGTAAHHILIDQYGNLSLVGDATQWDDAQYSLVGQRLESPSSDVVYNHAEGTVDFETGATLADYITMNIQKSHSWKAGSVIYPHLHWFQTSATIPNWLIQYRWQKNGAAQTTAWTPQKYTAHVYTWSAGTLNQITKFGTITPPAGYQLSDIVQYRILRDTTNASTLFAGADGLAATVSAVSFDHHYEKDGWGSNTEYSK